MLRCFYINLYVAPSRSIANNALIRPIGSIAAIILFFNLNLLPHQRHCSFAEHVQDFDFIGLGLMTSGVVTLLLGLNSSETACISLSYVGHIQLTRLGAGNSVETVTLLVAGVVLLVLAAVSECYTKRAPILPPRIFKVISPSQNQGVLI